MLHAMHTPALVPPQPLRASPALPQPPHAVQSLAPAAENVPDAHGAQTRSEMDVGGTVRCSPATHIVCRVQEPWPALG